MRAKREKDGDIVLFVEGKESRRRAGKGEKKKERIRRKGIIKMLLIQRITEAPSGPTASRNERPLGVKTWCSLKWSRERFYTCKELVSCSVRVCMSERKQVNKREMRKR